MNRAADYHTPFGVIYSTIGRELPDNRKSLDLARNITLELAHWLTMQAGAFEPFDERTPGYADLAQRLTSR